MKLNISNPEIDNICVTCGTRFERSKMPAGNCPICDEPRQYMKPYGQQWTSYHKLAATHRIEINQLHTNVYELYTNQRVGISPRAFLLCTSEGNVLWDCLGFIDEPTVAFINKLGGLHAITVSHPHYYSLMVEWAKAFHCPIYLHKLDKEWIMDDESQVEWIDGDEKSLTSSVKVVRTGGHFDGSTVLHDAAEGILFVSDSFFVSIDKQFLSVMYSYPNMIPLSKEKSLMVFESVQDVNFEIIYGGFRGQNITVDGRKIFDSSFQHYREL